MNFYSDVMAEMYSFLKEAMKSTQDWRWKNRSHPDFDPVSEHDVVPASV